MENKQTAVEWLVNELKKSKHWYRLINEVHQNSTINRDVIEQAKAMEKEQIVDAYNNADAVDENNIGWKNSDQYYNETYEK